MKKILSFGALIVLVVLCMGVAAEAAAAKAAAEAENVIGVIESQAIISKHPGYENATKNLQQILKQKDSELRSAVDKETDNAKKAQLAQAKRIEMAREEQRLMEPILKDCQEAVRIVAKNKKITIVLEKTYVFFGGIDMTEDVVQQVKVSKTK
ncbi:HlpA protein [Synergistales bacterium]|nr:HlpA protein [Synergistales bacterium]